MNKKELVNWKNILKTLAVLLSIVILFVCVFSYNYLKKGKDNSYVLTSPLILTLIILGSIVLGVFYLGVNILFIRKKIKLSLDELLTLLTIIHLPLYLMLLSFFNIKIDFVGEINLYLYVGVGCLSFLALTLVLWNINKDYAVSLFKLIALLVALYYIVIYIVIFVYQVRYPFEIEWMEGGSVDHVIRILQGQKLYVEPSIEFVPYIYTPFYFYVSALFWLIFGVSFVPLRLVSFLSTIGCFVVIFFFVKKETKSNYWGIISTGVFAATYQLSGAWFNIGRVDPLATFLLILAVYLLKNHKSIPLLVISGVLTFLSFFTKQSIFLILAGLFIYSIVKHRLKSIAFIIPALLGIILSTIIANILSDGWYSYYIFELPKYHNFLEHLLYAYWTKDIMSSFTIGMMFLLFYILHTIPLKRDYNKITRFIFYLFVPLSFIFTSWLSRIHSGGYLNVLIPAFLMISILFIIGLSKVYDFIKNRLNNKIYLIFMYVICIVQLALLFYLPTNYIPTKEDLRAGEHLVEVISKLEGEVIMPSTGYIPRLAGKNTMYAHNMAIYDVVRVRTNKQKPNEIKTILKKDIERAFSNKKYDAVITHRRNWYGIQRYYKIKETLFKKDEFVPVTGAGVRPRYVYVPK